MAKNHVCIWVVWPFVVEVSWISSEWPCVECLEYRLVARGFSIAQKPAFILWASASKWWSLSSVCQFSALTATWQACRFQLFRSAVSPLFCRGGWMPAIWVSDVYWLLFARNSEMWKKNYIPYWNLLMRSTFTGISFAFTSLIFSILMQQSILSFSVVSKPLKHDDYSEMLMVSVETCWYSCSLVTQLSLTCCWS